MSAVAKNVAMNVVAKPIGIALSIVLIPLYIKFLGTEAYGVLGLYASACVLFNLLDCGLGLSLNRGLARLSVPAAGEVSEAASLTYTLEIIYWAIGAACGVAIYLLAYPIANQWLKPEHIPIETIATVLRIGSVAFLFQWPVSLYSNGLNGLQDQVMLNVLSTVIGLLRGLGTLLVLWGLSPTVEAYFYCQLVAVILHVMVLRLRLWTLMPGGRTTAHFSWSEVSGVWSFASGTFLLTLLSMLLNQLDRVLLSNLLSLKMFGFYVLASTGAATALSLGNSIYTAMFPRLCQLTSASQETELSRIYHLGCQLSSVVVFPPAMLLVFFGKEVLLVWTGNQELSLNTGPIISLLAIGYAINSIMGLPLGLQLAHGWLKLGIYKSIIAVIVFVPVLSMLVYKFGALGAASCWIFLNLCYFGLEIPYMHRRILKGEAGCWYLSDVLPQLVVSLAVVATAKLVIRTSVSRPNLALELGVALLSATIVASCASRNTRLLLRIYIEKCERRLGEIWAKR